MLIQRLVKDLDIPVDVVGVSTFRESDGLALSSRNAYLTKKPRAVAPALYRELSAAATDIAAGVNIPDRGAAAWAAPTESGIATVD